MNLVEILEEESDESGHLEYKGKRADNLDIIKELVALANNDGGRLLYGVRQSGGTIEQIQDISETSKFEEDISQTITSRVDPILPTEVRTVEYDGSSVVGIKVDHQGLLYTFDPGNHKPCIPMRVGSTTDYLGGAAIREFYRSRFESGNSGLTGWLDHVRKQAHRITYTYKKNDFTEIEERRNFVEAGSDVLDQLETKLEEPHRELDDSTRQLMDDLVNTCEEISDIQVSATPNITFSDNVITTSDYLGDPPEKVEEKFREKAESVNEAAISLKQHLEG